MNEIAKQMRLRQWAADLEDWRQSGLTQTAWIKIKGISRDAWKYRKRQVEKHIELLMREDLAPAVQPVDRLPEPLQIVPVPNIKHTDDQIEISLSGGTVRVPLNTPPELLRIAICEVMKNA